MRNSLPTMSGKVSAALVSARKPRENRFSCAGLRHLAAAERHPHAAPRQLAREIGHGLAVGTADEADECSSSMTSRVTMHMRSANPSSCLHHPLHCSSGVGFRSGVRAGFFGCGSAASIQPSLTRAAMIMPFGLRRPARRDR